MSSARVRPDDEDFGDLDIRKKPSSSNATLIVLLACGIVGVVLLTCVGVEFVRFAGHNDPVVPKPAERIQEVKVQPIPQGPEAAKLNGAWKGRLVLRGNERDDVYTFREDGTLREDVFDLRGNHVQASEARWRFRDGKVEIDWPGGGVEVATVRWIDDNTMEYQIVNHTDAIQIGLKMTFRRQ
jgi:hypothetical protein